MLRNNPKIIISTTETSAGNAKPWPEDELKPQAIMGGIGQRKQVLDDPVDEPPVREPRITKLTPANTAITARVGNRGKFSLLSLNADQQLSGFDNPLHMGAGLTVWTDETSTLAAYIDR